MRLPINAFDLVDKLINENFHLALPVQPAMLLNNINEDFISTTTHNTVNLGELLSHMKKHIIKLQHENRELKSDLKTIVTNGSIHKYIDLGYYDNHDAVAESYRIYEKWERKNSV